MYVVVPALIAAFIAPAPLTPRPEVIATRTPVAPVLDGRLDDSAWTRAAPVARFLQKAPRAGLPPSARTTVRVLFDDEALYVGVQCDQPGDPVVARLTRRDREVESDRIEVDLATRGDGKSAFYFSVNAAGVLADGVRFDDTQLSLDWDENWEAATALTDQGWSAELRIPFRMLRFDAEAQQVWGVQVRRHLSRLQETDELALIPPEAAGEVSHYGVLSGLEGIHDSSAWGSVELRPFVLGQVKRQDRDEPYLVHGVESRGSAGLDLKWHLSQDLTLDAAINPDFGQVEADEVVLNLGTFEQFVPEKRPFFLEGAETFVTAVSDVPVLHTRRIGRQPDAPALPDGDEPLRPPEPVPIYAAVKLIGRPTEGLAVGALSAVGGQVDVEVREASGRRRTRMAEPLTLYEALRVKQDLGENAHVGLIGTATLRLEEDKAYPTVDGQALCPSGAEVEPGARCFHDAYVGGADARWRSDSGDYSVIATVLASAIEGGPPRELPDGTTIASGDVAPAGLVSVSKDGGHWHGLGTYFAVGRKFELNDLGYLDRQNIHGFWAEVVRSDSEPTAHFLETNTRLAAYRRQNLDGQTVGQGYILATWGELLNHWGYYFDLYHRRPHFDDRELGNGVALERAGLVGVEAWLNSDPRSAVSVEFGVMSQALQNGHSDHASVNATFRVLPQLDIELEPAVNYSSGEPRLVESDTDTYVFGRLRATSLGVTLRTTWTFTPRLSLQTYGQAFTASGHYSDFSRFVGPDREIHLVDLVDVNDVPGSSGPSENPDFRESVLNANVVLRWEYLLGSTLFVVYSRAQGRGTSFEPGQKASFDLGTIGRGPATDVVLVKLSYWWG